MQQQQISQQQQASSPHPSSDFFSSEARMKNTHALTSAIERASLRQTNNNRPLAGALVLLIHTAVVTIILWLILWSSTRAQVYIGLCLWLTIMFQHWYFCGCWGVRSERKVWNTKEWYGPWTSLFRFLHSKLNVPNDKRVHEAVFVIFAILVLYTTYHRLQTM